MKNIVGAIAALGLAVSPVAAIAVERAVAPVQQESELGGGADVFAALGIFAVVIGAFLIAADSDDEPVSA